MKISLRTLLLPAKPFYHSLRGTWSNLSNQVFQFLNKTLGYKGINLGSGNWKRLGWCALDNRYFPGIGTTLNEKTLFPFKDNQLKYVFSSHFFEHVSDEVAEHLISESYRVLQKQGLIRISVPDFEMTMERYLQEDNDFFDNILGIAPRYENWEHNSVPVCLENKLLYQFASYDNMDDQGLFPPWKFIPEYYCGPPKIEPEVIRRKARELDIDAFSKWAVSLVPKDRISVSHGHVNAYTPEKLEKILKKVGFTNICRSEFQNSRKKTLRSSDFDNRPEQSLFMEAIKP